MSVRKTAEDFAKEQKEISVSEFFEKNKHLLGFDNPTKSLLMAVKEAVDNSLDACEEAGILPDITVKIRNTKEDVYIVSVSDNGPGIVKEQIPRIFGKLLYGSKFHRLKQSLTADEPIITYIDQKVKILPIGEFVDGLIGNEDVKDVSDFNIKVPSFDWKEHKYKFRNVSHVIRHKRQNEIIKIKLGTNREIKVTGCHSLFSVQNGKIREIEARDLKTGDFIAVPRCINPPEEIVEINILDYLTLDDIKNNWFYVYDIETCVFKNLLKKAKIVHKKTDKSRKYYRIGNIDILDGSWKQYITKHFLPLGLVIRLGLAKDVKDCVLKSYFHGKETKIPISFSLEPYFLRFLGLFVAEGHVDKRQIGLTLGKHEDALIEEVINFARRIGVNFTLENRDRSIRIKIFGGILSTLLEKWCGKGAHNKHVPEFIFRVNNEKRQYFIDGLYQGDGHHVKNRNCIMLNTVSKTLANELMYLWMMQGVTSHITTRTGKGLGIKPYLGYVVSVYGNDINKSHVFRTNKPVRTRSFNYNSAKLLTQIESDILLVKIKNMEIIKDGYDFVYDISVPECENFVGGLGGIACHNSRGQQGIGISSVTLYSQLTTGVPTKVWSKVESKKKTHYCELHLDTTKNEPDVIKEEDIDKDVLGEHGVRIDMEIHGRYRKTVEDYLKQTSISNPFAKIVYTAPDGTKTIFPRSLNELPSPSKIMKPHPHGMEFGVLQRLLQKTSSRTLLSFLTNEFSSVGQQSAKEICKTAKLQEDIKPQEMDRVSIEKLIKSMQTSKVQRPPTDCLSPVGEIELEKSLKKEYPNAEFITSIKRDPEVYRGFPFLIEVGIVYGFQEENKKKNDDDERREDSIELIRFANRVPLLYQQSACALTEAVKGVDWRRYNMQQSGSNLPVGPMKLVIHICSVWVPFVSESKEAVASYPEIIKETKLALQDAGRKLASFLSGKRRVGEQKRRLQMFERYANEVANALAILSGDSEKDVEKKLRILIESRVHTKNTEDGEGAKNTAGKAVGKDNE